MYTIITLEMLITLYCPAIIEPKPNLVFTPIVLEFGTRCPLITVRISLALSLQVKNQRTILIILLAKNDIVSLCLAVAQL